MEKCACVRLLMVKGKTILAVDGETDNLAIPDKIIEKYDTVFFLAEDTPEGLLLTPLTGTFELDLDGNASRSVFRKKSLKEDSKQSIEEDDKDRIISATSHL